MKCRILVAEDEAPIREGIVTAFADNGYDVVATGNGREAIRRLEEENFDLVISDVRMPDKDGLEVLRRARGLNEEAMVIMMTAYGTVEHAVQAMREGAFDYLQKPFNLEDLEFRVAKALEHVRLRDQVRYLEDRITTDFRCENMIGTSRTIRDIFRVIQKVAPSNAAILVQGETGTGKELIAAAVHQHSLRREAAFVKMNCAALPETLLESELFGHEKGAFTGAVERRAGYFELANGGTILLDEITEMSPALQAKYLRALQDGVVRRLGGKSEVKVDVRVIAATNRDPVQAIKEGKFREDLYYRLNVLNVTLAPLRQRKGDIALLVEGFIKEFNEKYMKKISGIDDESLRILNAHEWPGNVRELRNTIERAVLQCEGERLAPDCLRTAAPFAVAASAPPAERSDAVVLPVGTKLDQAEKVLILRTLEAAQLNKTRAAKILGVSTKTIHSKLRRYQIARAS